jgi:hypothetical protein
MTTWFQDFFISKFGKPQFGNREQIKLLHNTQDIILGKKPVQRISDWEDGYLYWDAERGEWPKFKKTMDPRLQTLSWCHLKCPECQSNTKFVVWFDSTQQEDGFLDCEWCTLEFCQHDNASEFDVYVKQEAEQ